METTDYIKFFAALIFVLGLMGGLALVLKRIGLGPASMIPADKRRLKVLEILPLDARRKAVLLARDGAPAQALPRPQFGRSLACTAMAGGPLAALADFDIGLYTTQRLMADALPAGWTLAAQGEDGRVLAAVHPQRRAAVLLCRPDSVLSLRHVAGQRALSALLDWLAAPAA